MLLLDQCGSLQIESNLDVGQSNEYYKCRITGSCIVDINVDLEFYVAESHR